jgi:pyridoxamine 5'-phosphate oxidase
MKLDSFRNEYKYSEMSKYNVSDNPFKQFEKWLEEALKSGEKLPTAMTVSTIGADGFPNARIVLLKYFDEMGFVFFSNYNSNKGKAIEKNNATGLHFFWPEMERQVIITGLSEKTERELSEKYFGTRPIESQISAWASPQSEEIPSRKHLEQRYNDYLHQFENQEIPLPPFWGGYRVVPHSIEFWQGRINRLHDRILYEKKEAKWIIKRLAP